MKKSWEKAYNHGFPSSRTLRQAAENVIQVKKELRHENVKHTQNKEKNSQLEKTRDQYKKHFKIVQKNAAQHRDNDLDRLARKRAAEWNIKASQAIVVIKAAEESKKLHTKQRAFLNPKREGGIRKIMVPTPITNIQPKSTHVTNEKIQCTIYDPKEICLMQG